MAQTSWRGVFPALTTKFNPDSSLDFDGMARHLEFQLDAGVHGIIILGSLGENPTLDTAEKVELMRFFRQQVNGRVPLLACIAESGTREARDLARQGEAIGMDGYMLLPPMRYPSDRLETRQYFNDVADATGLPIMLYNNPVAYGTDIIPEEFARLADNPSFIAIKESSANTRRVADIRRLVGNRYDIFCGVDDLALECFALGAVGWVAGLVVAFPRETMAMYRLMTEERWAEARSLYEWFLPLLHLDIGPKFVQQIKLVEERMDVGTARVRAPRLPLSPSEAEHVDQVLQEALAHRPAV